MKLKKIFLISFLAIIFIFTFYYLNSNKKNESDSSRNGQNPIEKNNEWLEVSEYTFVRLGTATYFIDKSKISILATTTINLKSLNGLNFKFTVEIYDENDVNHLAKYFLNDIKFKKFFHEVPLTTNFNYEMFAIFELNRKVYDDVSKIRMRLRISTPQEKDNTQPIKLSIKNRLTSNSENIIICSEPSYLEPNDFVDMKWFIDINTAMGFDKINIYNNSIPATREFSRLFKLNEKTTRVTSYNYLPNLIETADETRNLKKYVYNMKGKHLYYTSELQGKKYFREFLNFHRDLKIDFEDLVSAFD